jgi:hypothetical protein
MRRTLRCTVSDFPLAEVVSWWRERRPALSHDQNDRVIGDDGKKRGRSRGLCLLNGEFPIRRNGRKRHERDDRATKQMVAAVVEAVAVAEVAAVGRVLM